MWKWGILVVALLVVGSVGALSVLPDPGHCDVRVGVGVLDVGVFGGTVYSITSVSPGIAGQTKIIDWTALGLGLAPPAAYAQLTMTVSLSDGQSVSRYENQFVPSVPLLNGASFTASDTFTLTYVPFGSYGVNVALTQSGAGTVASGSSSLTVGC